MNDLKLSETYVPDVPKDIIFPDELNAYLRDQIQVRNNTVFVFIFSRYLSILINKYLIAILNFKSKI